MVISVEQTTGIDGISKDELLPDSSALPTIFACWRSPDAPGFYWRFALCRGHGGLVKALNKRGHGMKGCTVRTLLCVDVLQVFQQKDWNTNIVCVAWFLSKEHVAG